MVVLGIVVIIVLIAVPTAFLNAVRISRLKREVEELRSALRRFSESTEKPAIDEPAIDEPEFVMEPDAEPARPLRTAESTAQEPPESPELIESIKSPEFPESPEHAGADDIENTAQAQAPAFDHERIHAERAEAERRDKRERRAGLEKRIGARLPIWIGGVALALAGVFLVKYSIDAGLLSPTIRVIMAGIFGIALLGAGKFVADRPNIANQLRIAQALSGAGIGVLYGALMAATTLYDLIPPLAGFIGMGLVTGVAVIFSLVLGPPIALLGLAGGFLTPVLIKSDTASAAGLFSYLALITTGLTVTARQRGWTALLPLVLAGALGWPLIWLMFFFNQAESVWVGMYLLVIAGVLVWGADKQFGLDVGAGGSTASPSKYSSWFGTAGAGALLAGNAAMSGCGPMHWAFLWLLSAGCMVLAFLHPRRYEIAPWIGLVITTLLMVIRPGGDAVQSAWTCLGFALLFTGGGAAAVFFGRRPFMWSLFSSVSGLALFLAAYLTLEHTVLFTHIPMFWGGLALALAALAMQGVFKVYARFRDHEDHDRVTAVYLCAATAFLSLGMTIELEYRFLHVTLAGEALALVWIHHHIALPALRRLAGILGGAAVLLALPQLVGVSAFVLFSQAAGVTGLLPSKVMSMYWFHFGLPACGFLLAAELLHRGPKPDRDRIEMFFAVAGLLSAVLFSWCLFRSAYAFSFDYMRIKPGFLETSLITDMLFLLGLAASRAGMRFDRPLYFLGGSGISCAAVVRAVSAGLVVHNPMDGGQSVGAWPVFNALIPAYLIPAVMMWFVSRDADRTGMKQPARILRIGSAVFVFLFLNFCVRQIFHGTDLAAGHAGSAEIYTYSAVWLLFGIGLLTFGILRGITGVRIASLCVLALTAAKVFLYDASELEGLYRVFSFFGLGLSLVGLGWAYARFAGKEE